MPARGTGHQLKGTPEYSVWVNMRQRCNNPHGHDAHYYKDISHCPEWNDPVRFVEDMGKRPSADHQLDRIDSNGDYTPENCRWVLPKQQQNNRSSNVILEYQGRSQTMQEWCDELGLSKYLVRTRLFIYGLSVDEALTRPVRQHIVDCGDMVHHKGAKPITFNGETHTIREWAKRLGVVYRTLKNRVRRWGPEKAIAHATLQR